MWQFESLLTLTHLVETSLLPFHSSSLSETNPRWDCKHTVFVVQGKPVFIKSHKYASIEPIIPNYPQDMNTISLSKHRGVNKSQCDGNVGFGRRKYFCFFPPSLLFCTTKEMASGHFPPVVKRSVFAVYLKLFLELAEPLQQWLPVRFRACERS